MATKAVDKYSRRGYKEVCCPESCPRTPSTWLPRLSGEATSTAGEATNGYQVDKTMATRRLVLPREVPNDAKRAGQRS